MLTTLSGEVGGTTILDTDPRLGCDERECLTATGGWPFAYAIDDVFVSPTGSADAIGAYTGIGADLDVRAWWLGWLFWSAVAGATSVVWVWVRHNTQNVRRAP